MCLGKEEGWARPQAASTSGPVGPPGLLKGCDHGSGPGLLRRGAGLLHLLPRRAGPDPRTLAAWPRKGARRASCRGDTVPGLRREAELPERCLVRLRLGIGTDDDPGQSLRGIPKTRKP